MKKFFKRLAIFIAGIFCFLLFVFYGLLFAVTGSEPLTQIARGFQNKCEADLAKETTLVNFVERDLYLSSKHLHACYPLDMSTSFDYDPASVSLVGILPDFSVPNFEPGIYLEKEDEIRIHFTGSRPDINKIDPMIKLGFSDLEKNFQYMMNVKLNRDGQKIAKYDEGQKTNFGLTFYKTNATGTFAKDLYVHENSAGKVDFMIECYNKDKKPTPPVLYCSSVSENLYDNISFKYAFTLKHIVEAEKIDALVKKIVQDATAPK
ncbi:MAG: hypothetical protein DI586_02010 [Micavibrio aeruginosavorus]|uniref:Uncharacterized protein n=1 Tax=Micavibrio aeruginosavorus TaxID=349221 RepID=A0A2W5FLQ2_9BACT|nr:MAG: hypothetical protein DI586_02010 [Micavibrio aeruginosavorus]